MNLERRTFLIVFVTVVVATAVAFMVAKELVNQSVRSLEEKGADENLRRASQAIDDEIADLDGDARGWAHRDDVYAFAQGNDSSFPATHLGAAAFKQHRLSLMMFLGPDGRVIYTAAFDAARGSFVALPEHFRSAANLRPLVGHPFADVSVSGIVMAGPRPVLVSSWPILTSESRGPPAGTLIWGRDLDAAALGAVEDRTLLDLRVIPWTEAMTDPVLATLATKPEAMRLREESAAVLSATGMVQDIEGRPAFALEVRMDRPVYEQSVQNLVFGLASTIVVGAAILVLITVMLDRTVFTPLHRLKHDVEALGSGAAGGRVSAPRDDEIGHVAASFNRLMGRLDRDKVNLQRSNQDLRDFAAVVSHDLQPPLSTIALNAAVVRERERTRLDADAMQRLDRLESTALRMADHIRSILDYSRVSSQEAPMADVNLNDIMEDVINDLEERLHATGGRIEYRSMPHLQGNRTQLLQLMLNLMGNALKYHRPGVPPVVKIHAEPYADGKGWQGWRVVIADNGVGFDSAELDRMVRPYIRLEHRVEGYGLGLATCHKIIQRHHGRLSAHSVPDQGSAFMVDLPAVQPTDDPDGPATTPAGP